jgi:hypothetical protein
LAASIVPMALTVAIGIVGVIVFVAVEVLDGNGVFVEVFDDDAVGV